MSSEIYFQLAGTVRWTNTVKYNYKVARNKNTVKNKNLKTELNYQCMYFPPLKVKTEHCFHFVFEALVEIREKRDRSAAQQVSKG